MKKKIYGILLGVTIVLIAVGIFISNDYKLNPSNQKPYYPSDWILETDGTGSVKEISLPYSFKFDGNYHYSLSTKIDYSQDDHYSPYLFLSMNHSYFKVFIDEQEIYSYTKENTPNLSKSPGNIYTAVPLPADFTGKTLRIEFTLTLERGLTYVLSDIFFNDYPSEIHSTFMNDLAHNSIIMAILLIGVLLIFISIFALKNVGKYDTFFIGFFAFLVGIYGLSESLFIQYMFANPYLGYLVNFVIFAAILAPILAFYKRKVSRSFRVPYIIGLSLVALNIGIQLLLHFTRIADIRQTLICTHLLYFVCFLLIILSVGKSSKDECAERTLLIALILPIIIGGISDALLHYVFAGISERNTTFSQLGVLITLFIASTYLTKNMLLTYQEHLNAQTYKTLAFKDGLTGIYNRTAYNQEITLLSENPDDNEDLICICADINGLKRTNDCDGHLAGDQLIQETACILNSTFCKYGKVFRIGGDEFAAFLYNLEEDTLKNILASMYNEIEQYNTAHTPPISFSIGYELLKNIGNKDIKECFRHADRKMYEEKEKYKIMNRE